MTAPITDATTAISATADTTSRDAYIDALTSSALLPQAPTENTKTNAIADGEAVCAMFDDGATFRQVADDLLAQGNDDAGTLIGAATYTLCPEHYERIPQ